MKLVPCRNPSCRERRVHHERQDEPRGVQLVEVPDDHTIYDPAFCSITCAVTDGFLSMRIESDAETFARRARWKVKQPGVQARPPGGAAR